MFNLSSAICHTSRECGNRRKKVKINDILQISSVSLKWYPPSQESVNKREPYPSQIMYQVIDETKSSKHIRNIRGNNKEHEEHASCHPCSSFLLSLHFGESLYSVGSKGELRWERERCCDGQWAKNQVTIKVGSQNFWQWRLRDSFISSSLRFERPEDLYHAKGVDAHPREGPMKGVNVALQGRVPANHGSMGTQPVGATIASAP